MARPSLRAVASLRPPLALVLKLAVPITALLVAVIVLLGSVLLARAERSLLTETAKRGQLIAQYLANTARSPLLTKDELALSLVVKDGMKESDVVYVVITDHQGTVVAQGDATRNGRGRERATAQALSVTDPLVESSVIASQGRVLDVAIPLTFRRSTVGVVFVGLNQTSVDEAMSQMRNRTVAIGVGLVVAGLLVSVGLAMLLVRSGGRGGARKSGVS
jgi:sensor histidine kinase regulating citrate/malate metabolism